MSLPPAVKRALVKRGLMDEQSVTRTPRPRHCSRCRRAVLAAIDDLGITVAVDPVPTTAAAELAAVMAGRRTLLHHNGALIARSARMIRRYSADLFDVHIAHDCGIPPPPMNPKRIRPPKRKEDDNAAPPY